MKHIHTHTKRALALLLTLSLFVSLGGLAAFADDNDPPWTETVTADSPQSGTVEGNVVVDGGRGVEFVVNSGSDSVTITGSVTSGGASSNQTDGVYVQAAAGAEATVTVGGSVTASGGSQDGHYFDTNGVEVMLTGTGAKASVTVDGDVTSLGFNENDMTSIGIYVFPASDTFGYYLPDYITGTSAVITVGGVVSGPGIGIDVTGGKVEITVGADSDAAFSVQGGSYDGLSLDNLEEGSSVTVYGGVKGGDKGIYLSDWVEREDCSSVTVYGDVEGGHTGLELDMHSDVLIAGTLTGGSTGVKAGKLTAEKTSLTVWKIDAPTIVTGVNAEDFAAKINYIVKTGDGVSAEAGVTDKTFGATDNDPGTTYQTATEGKTVLLSAPSGYAVKNGNTVLPRDENGYYFFVVERGGGMDFLAALLESQGPGLFDSSVSDAAIVVLQLVFEDGAGGAAAVSVAQNKPFTMPAAPEREGWRFLGWQAEIDGQTVVFAPGERVKLSEAVVFRALWAPTVGEEAAMKLAVREA